VLTVPDVDFHGGALNTFMLAPIGRVAGVIARQPGLTVEVKGNSDASGADGERFSEVRADSVRDALVRGGLRTSAVRIRALGNANPIGPNRTMEEKTRNRRVEIVVSGDAIGTMASWDKPYTIK
jgi:outer membrane protein OmpA-like peptidoglycan-associated protein